MALFLTGTTAAVWDLPYFMILLDCLFGLVVKAYASRAEDPGFESHLRRDFSRVESYQ